MQFKDKIDHLLLLDKLTTIKRAPHEYMTNFNYRFQKTWDRIPTAIKPSPSNTFLYYLRAFNSDIATILQSMGEGTLPNSYEISIRVENILIQGGKLAPNPPMPFCPNIPNHQPILAPVPITSTSQSLVVVPIASTSSNGVDKIEAMMEKLMQNIDKKLHDQEKKMEDNSAVMQKNE